jgi:hypothetical protein
MVSKATDQADAGETASVGEAAAVAETPFLARVEDTGAMIDSLRAAIEGHAQEQERLHVLQNELRSQLDALIALRQAHGLPPR